MAIEKMKTTKNWNPTRRQIKTVLMLLGAEYARLHPYKGSEGENAEVGFRRKRLALWFFILGIFFMMLIFPISLTGYEGIGYEHGVHSTSALIVVCVLIGISFIIMFLSFLERAVVWVEWKKIRKLILKRKGEFWVLHDANDAPTMKFLLIERLSWRTVVKIVLEEIKPKSAPDNWKPYHPSLDRQREEMDEISMAFAHSINWEELMNDAKEDPSKFMKRDILAKRNCTHLRWLTD